MASASKWESLLRHMRMLVIMLLSPLLSAQSLQVDASRHDFGKVPSNSKSTHTFRITNGGDKDLVIGRIHTSCGCTSTVLGKSTLAPGESTGLEAVFNTGNDHGPVEKTIRVESNDPKSPTTSLSIAAEVIRDLYIDPPTAMFFDAARRGTRELTLRLKSDTGSVKVEALDIASVPYLSSDVRVEGDTVFLDLRFNPAKAPRGQFQGHGRFQVKTSQPSNGALVVPVVWSLARVFVAAPNRIGMSMVPGEEQRVTVRVSRADGKSFKILGTSSEAAASNASTLRVQLPKTPEGKTLELSVIITAGLRPGLHRETLAIKTDDPDEPTLTMPVNLLVAASPSVDAKAASKSGK